MDKTLIIDFDSTFIKLEALDELAKIALARHPDGKRIAKQITNITKQGMEGKINFDESLSRRLSLFSPTEHDIEKLIRLLRKNITTSITVNKAFFKTNASDCYIISGGFKEYIAPITQDFGIKADHILANSFVFKDNRCLGFNTKSPLCQASGKVKAVRKLRLQKPVVVIGDGFTDLEIKKSGLAEAFIAFTENVKRDQVAIEADAETTNFDQVIKLLSSLPQSGLLSRHGAVNETICRGRIPDQVRNGRGEKECHTKTQLTMATRTKKALLLEDINQKALETLKKAGFQVERLSFTLPERELIKKISDVSILGVRSKTKITPSILKAAPNLLAIGCFSVGTDNIDTKSCADRGVAVFNAPFSSTRSVAELTLGEIIVLTRKTFEKSTKMHQGNWDKNAAGCHEIRGLKLGIIGYGKIGSQLSIMTENLGMKVLFHDIKRTQSLGNAKACSMHTLLETADVISLHVDGRKENLNLIGSCEFSMMKDGVIFLNLSRGLVVDVKALAANIKNGKIAGAAIDVFPHEPEKREDIFVSELQNLPNVILTPHIGGNTEEAQCNIAEFVTDKLIEFVETGDSTLSLNFPNLELANGKHHCFSHLHKNTPGVLAQINNVLASHGCNIEGQNLKTNEHLGYVITETNKAIDDRLLTKLNEITATIKSRRLP